MGNTGGMAACYVRLLPLILGAISFGQPPEQDRQFSLGVGVLSSPRPYVGADNEWRVIPLLDFKVKRYYLRGVSTGIQLLEGPISVDVEARMQFAGFDSDDSPFLVDMDERRETVEMGVVVARQLGSFELQAQVHNDVLGRSHGMTADLSVTWRKVFGRGQGGVFPSFGVVWQDADFVDYYAGVRSHEALEDRPAYTGKAALNMEAGLRAFYRLTSRITAIAFIKAERLSSEFYESPIIADKWGAFAISGVTYSF